MEKLTENKSLYEKQIKALKETGLMMQKKPIELSQYKELLKSLKKFWAEGCPETRAKIIQWLVYKIEVGRDDVTIHYQLTESGLVNGSSGSGRHKKDFKTFYLEKSSNSLTSGAGTPTRTVDLQDVDLAL